MSRKARRIYRAVYDILVATVAEVKKPATSSSTYMN